MTRIDNNGHYIIARVLEDQLKRVNELETELEMVKAECIGGEE